MWWGAQENSVLVSGTNLEIPLSNAKNFPYLIKPRESLRFIIIKRVLLFFKKATYFTANFHEWFTDSYHILWVAASNVNCKIW